jgi:hypothetical protein
MRRIAVYLESLKLENCEWYGCPLPPHTLNALVQGLMGTDMYSNMKKT